jgi:hypothetical protein
VAADNKAGIIAGFFISDVFVAQNSLRECAFMMFPSGIRT